LPHEAIQCYTVGMNLPLKKYAEWLSARGQIWPVTACKPLRDLPPATEKNPVACIRIGAVTLLHNGQAALSPANATMLERIAAACKGKSITIAFGDTAAAYLLAVPVDAPDGCNHITAPDLDILASDHSAKRVLWQEIQQRISLPQETQVVVSAQ
jgi:hypothetical protein